MYVYYIFKALKEMFRAVKEWVWNPIIEIILGFIKVLLSIEDELITTRIQILLMSEMGFLKILLNEKY